MEILIFIVLVVVFYTPHQIDLPELVTIELGTPEMEVRMPFVFLLIVREFLQSAVASMVAWVLMNTSLNYWMIKAILLCLMKNLITDRNKGTLIQFHGRNPYIFLNLPQEFSVKINFTKFFKSQYFVYKLSCCYLFRWTSQEISHGSYTSDDCVGDIAELKFDRAVPIKPHVKYALRLRNHGGRTSNGDGGVSSVKGMYKFVLRIFSPVVQFHEIFV